MSYMLIYPIVKNSLQMVQTVGWFVAVIDDIYVIRKPDLFQVI